MDFSENTQEIIDFISETSDEDLEDYNDLSDKFVHAWIEEALIELVSLWIKGKTKIPGEKK